MAFDENLVGRIRRQLGRTGTEEKRMFGGLAFLPEGTWRWPSGRIRSSLGPTQAEVALREPPITPFVNATER